MIDKSLRSKYSAENRKGFFRGAQADTRSGQSMSPGTSASGGSRNGGASHDRGGQQHAAQAAAAQAAAAQRAEADRQDRARQQAAIEQAARENEAREVAREKAIQVAALTPKKIEPVRSAHVDTPTQIAEQKEIDDWGFEGAKAKAPTTLIPTTVTPERGTPFAQGLIKTVTPQKISPTYYQDRSRIGGETWGERAEAGIKRPSGILGNLGKVALTLGTAGAGAGLFGKDIATVAKLANYKKRYDALQKSAIGEKLGLKELDFSNLRSNLNTVDGKYIAGDHHPNTKKRTFDEGKGDGEATLTKQVAGGENVIAKAINQYRGTKAEDQIASLVKNNLTKALQYYSMMTPKIEAGKANKQEMDAYELLGYYLNEVAPKQPMQGGSMYI